MQHPPNYVTVQRPVDHVTETRWRIATNPTATGAITGLAYRLSMAAEEYMQLLLDQAIDKIVRG